jgi:hypothetical protein
VNEKVRKLTRRSTKQWGISKMGMRGGKSNSQGITIPDDDSSRGSHSVRQKAQKNSESCMCPEPQWNGATSVPTPICHTHIGIFPGDTGELLRNTLTKQTIRLPRPRISRNLSNVLQRAIASS